MSMILPGFPLLFPAAVAPPEIAFFGSATSTGTTITVPASVIAGDLGLIFDAGINSSGSPTAVVPSGWTQRGTTLTVNTVNRRVISSFVFAGGEGGTNITGMAPTNYPLKAMIVLRRNTGTGTWTFGTINEQQTTGDPTAQNVTVGANPIAIFGDYFANPAVATPGFSPAQDAIIDVDSAGIHLVYRKIYNSSPSNTAIDMADGGSNILSSFGVSLVP